MIFWYVKGKPQVFFLLLALRFSLCLWLIIMYLSIALFRFILFGTLWPPWIWMAVPFIFSFGAYWLWTPLAIFVPFHFFFWSVNWMNSNTLFSSDWSFLLPHLACCWNPWCKFLGKLLYSSAGDFCWVLIFSIFVETLSLCILLNLVSLFVTNFEFFVKEIT